MKQNNLPPRPERCAQSEHPERSEQSEHPEHGAQFVPSLHPERGASSVSSPERSVPSPRSARRGRVCRHLHRGLFAAMTLFWLGFLFYQSSLGPEASSAASDGVRARLLAFLGGSGTLLGSFVNNSIRKIAHFAEFFALGASLSLHALPLPSEDGTRPDRRALRPLFLLEGGFCLLVSLADEGLQHFTGRTPAFLDVLIDCAGAASALFIVYLTALAVLCRRAAKERNCRV